MTQYAVCAIHDDNSIKFAGKEGYQTRCEDPEWTGTIEQARGKARYISNLAIKSKARAKEGDTNGKFNDVRTVKIVPVTFSYGTPQETFKCE